MKILDLLNRSTAPLPWAEGDNIPWNDPQFSHRMLQEHLCQDHDAASRRSAKIDQHVGWIHRHLLSGQSTRILDLCCGPGLYANRLARLGHACVGIDYSPASIAYALNQSKKEKLRCTYKQEDIRTAEYGSQFDLAMLIFGEFNVFPPQDAKQILKKILAAVAKNGLLLLEVHTIAAIREKGQEKNFWYSSEKGLFSDSPYLFLEESFWEPQGRTTTIRYYIIDARTGKVQRHAQSLQAYTKSQYRSVLEDHGFGHVEFYPSLSGEEDKSQSDFIVIVAKKEAEK
jgi:SAM-dependent methyltransferase